MSARLRVGTLLLGFVLAELPGMDRGQSSQAAQSSGAEEVIAKVSPAVVLILVGEGGEQPSALGSGVIVRSDGVVLTASHLVKDAQQVQVRLKNGEVFDRIELLAVDERRDIAALRISGHALPILPSVNAESVKAGEPVYVVSHPKALPWTASAGILSAVRLADEVPGAGSGYRLLQFTAPVSAGSSGGVLVDAKGEALGIIVGSSQGQNLNFAVPIESVMGLASASQGKPFGSGAHLRLAERETAPAPRAAPVPATATAAEKPQIVRKIYIKEKEGGAFSGFPAQPVEKKLLENRDFQAMGFLLVTDQSSADIVVSLDRPTLSWDCTYRMMDRNTGAILGAGKNIAWDCIRAAPSIADQIVKQLKQHYPPQAPQKP